MLYWGSTRHLMSNTVAIIRSQGGRHHQALIGHMEQVLSFAHLHVTKLSESDALLAQAPASTLKMSAGVLYPSTRILDSIISIHKYLINQNMNSIMKEYRSHVKQQLNLGGGTFFRSISLLDKQFLNVSVETHGGGTSTPDDFLAQQKCSWSNTGIPLRKTLNTGWQSNFSIFE